jgi:prepilin-type N-terminal cleavage/methylation domain-containing protein
MKKFFKEQKQRGFTLIELLMVIAIIGILAAITLVALNQAGQKGRDSGRAAGSQEILKALELHYSDNEAYPSAPSGGVLLTDAGVQAQFIGVGKYMRRPPEDVERFYYCASADGRSMLLALDTEDDKGGSAYCSMLRGSGPDYGCEYTGATPDVDASDPCANRF